MALPTGSQSGPPQRILRRLVQWVDFAALLSAMVAVGLAKWLTHRLSASGGRQIGVLHVDDGSAGNPPLQAAAGSMAPGIAVGP
jgi:hypothetical protein